MVALSSYSVPTIFTERLCLRQLQLSDSNEIFRLRSNEDVNRYLDRPAANSLEDALQFITRINTSISNGDSMYWAITLKSNPMLVGTVCYWNFSAEHFTAEIGYEMDPAFQGRGIMKEVLPAVIDHGFRKMQLTRIMAETDPNNLNSIHLLLKNNFEKIEDSGITVYKLDSPYK